jgi:indolepyruvate decarboxylase
MSQSVIQYVLSRLKELGVAEIFGVPGDYAFPVNEAICNAPGMRWIGCCNELNAGYAADGYARVKGLAAVCTTYGVGELSALAAIAGSYSEHVPLFHLVGMPSLAAQASHALMHHTLGDGRFDLFHEMAAPAVCARAILTPENCVAHTERLIHAALHNRRPVYMGFPGNEADQPVVTGALRLPPYQSDPQTLREAVEAIAKAVQQARTLCLLPGVIVARLGLQKQLAALVDRSGLPWATMFMDKGVLDESHPNFVGMYDGKLMEENVRSFVEGCDLVLMIGTLLTDFNTGAFTAQLDPSRTIQIGPHHVRIGHAIYRDTQMADVLKALTQRLPKRTDLEWPTSREKPVPQGSGKDPITAEALYPRWSEFLQPNDIVIAETGTASMGLGFAQLPPGVAFHNQTLWEAIGWATPAALGAAVAAPNRRVLLITGEGSHQVTAQEIGQFHRQGLKPIIFVLNNSGYLIERLLSHDPETSYNDVAPWQYHMLPQALGCEGWFSARVATCGELDSALKQAAQRRTAAYIEVVTDKYASPELAQKMHDHMAALYPR